MTQAVVAQGDAPPQEEERTPTPLQQISAQLSGERMTRELRIALPASISVDKFRQVCITAISQNPELAFADRPSLFTACVSCAKDGLVPDGREAALAIYKTKNKTTDQWEPKVQYMPMIAGLYKKARENGLPLNGHVVFENDLFEYELGFEPMCRHKPALRDRGNPIGAYAVCLFKASPPEVEYMSISEINSVRQASKNPNAGPWKDRWDQMAIKTVVRRLSKRLPLSPTLDRMVRQQDDMYDMDKPAAAASARPAATAAALIEQAEGEPQKPFRLVDRFGKPLDRDMNDRQFAGAVCQQFARCENAAEIDAVCTHNADAINRLDEHQKKTIQEALDTASKRLRAVASETGAYPTGDAEEPAQDADDPLLTVARAVADKGPAALEAWFAKNEKGLSDDWMDRHAAALRKLAARADQAAGEDADAEQQGLGI